MSEKQASADSWDGLLINYLKADNLAEQQAVLICTGVEVKEGKLSLNVEYNEQKFVFSLNTTNMVFLKDNGILLPKEAIGKKIHVKKVLAQNPTTHKEVDSLRICQVEQVE